MNRLAFLLLMCGCTSSGEAPGPTDGSSPESSDSSPAGTDATAEAAEDAAAILTCRYALSAVCDAGNAGQPGGSYDCPPEFPEGLPGPWCEAYPYAKGFAGTCAGFTAINGNLPSDITVAYIYPADGGSLAAIVQGGESISCLAGEVGFSIPGTCFDLTVPHMLDPFDGASPYPGCSTFDAGLDGGSGSPRDAGVD
jgi:hypothetical protein